MKATSTSSNVSWPNVESGVNKVKKKELEVAIIVDLMGTSLSSPAEEIAEHKKRYSLILSDYDLKFSAPKCVLQNLSADLVLYDFGGMMPGTSLMEDNSRAIIKWAADHPSALVVVVSSYTFGAYVRPEMLALGLSDLKNVIQDDYEETTITSWFKGK